MADTGTLSANELKAIQAMLSARDVRDASKLCGVSERTMFRYLADAKFQAALRQATSDALTQTVRRLSVLSTLAVGCLAKEMANARATPSVRIKAACAILSHTLPFTESVDLNERVAAIESKLGET